MINCIWYQNKLLVEIVDDPNEKRSKLCIFEDGSFCKKSVLTNNIWEIACHECGKKKETKLYYNRINKKYICVRCNGLNHNPFKGKHHTEEYKKRLSGERKGKRLNPHSKSVYQWWVEKYGKVEADFKYKEYSDKLRNSCLGEKNGFYGKRHSQKTIDTIVRKNKIINENRTDEQKESISLKQSEFQKKQLAENNEKYRSDRRKAGQISRNSQKRYKKTKPEIAVENELKKRNLEHKYSVIFNFKQFDFGVGPKKYKILLEVHGDYWHANPNKYTTYTKSQIKNIKNDKEKLNMAQEYGFKVFYIWEYEINKKDFHILDDIERLIYEIRVSENREN